MDRLTQLLRFIK